MIKLFYYNADDFLKLLSSRKILSYSEQEFERLTNWQYNKEGNTLKPFRDEYSIKFLKNTYEIEFLSEDDWYSIQSPEDDRFCLSGLSRTMKYALTVLYNSQHGVCTEFKNCEECIWKVLDTMPFEILVAIDASKLDRGVNLSLGVDYVIENYPFRDKTIQLNVTSRFILGDDGYKKENRLYYKEGKYYIDAFSLDYTVCYYFWKEHIEEIIRQCEFCIKDEYPIIEKTMVCNLSGFLEKAGIASEDFMRFNNYFDDVWMFKKLLEEKEITKEEYDAMVSKVQEKEQENDYKKYLWMANDLSIVSHLYTLPDRTTSRKLPMLIVDKYSNGSYKIWGTLTVKYPKFDEILEDIVSTYYTEECERYVTVVDVEEIFTCAKDIKSTNCGFKVTKDCIEIFDHNDAIKMFASIAQEALNSDNVEISKEFY